MIVLTRIDDRLIHGQTVEGWVTFLKATRILVADDAVASNKFQRSVMELAVPEGLALTIGTVQEISNLLKASAFDRERVIVLFSNPADLLRALDAGMEIKSVNIGGMHFAPEKQKLLDVLAVDQKDLDALREMSARGIEVLIQTVPTERSVTLAQVLADCGITLGRLSRYHSK
ncbi:MAG: PTS sugar transporter subunit IIB [Nitrospirota bacterium]